MAEPEQDGVDDTDADREQDEDGDEAEPHTVGPEEAGDPSQRSASRSPVVERQVGLCATPPEPPPSPPPRRVM